MRQRWTRRAFYILGSTLFVVMGMLLPAGHAFAAINIQEYAVPASNNPLGITTGPDGNLWFTADGGNKVYKLTTGGTFTGYTIPTASATPFGIAAGPDGNMWVTENSGNKIAKVTTGGTVTEYAIPTASAFAQGIVAGSDGNMWFVESNTNKVGKITTSGVITEYSVPSTAGYPEDITAGPDGNLWVTEGNMNKIAKVTTSGVFTEYNVPTNSARPIGIAKGSDGNLWFAERDANKIGKVTTSGVITEYSIPTATSNPYGIAPGPDGSMWFVENVGKIGRITTAGVITEYTIPTASSSPQWNLVQGPDGNMWFTEHTASKIGVVQLLKPTASNKTANVVTGNSITVNVLSDATNNPNPATVTIDVAPQHGTATVNATTGAITYVPTSGYTGTDSLSFIVCSLDDSGLCSADPTITFTVASSTPSAPNTGFGVALLSPWRDVLLYGAGATALLAISFTIRKRARR